MSPRGGRDPEERAGHDPVRPARPEDLPALTSLEAACFEQPYSEELLRLELSSPWSVLLIAAGTRADVAGEAADGYAALRVVAGEAELLRVAVRPEGRQRGLGRALVEAGLRAVEGRGAARCFLEVHPENRPAIALYRALGFDDAGRRPRYYSDGSDALVMARRAEEAPRLTLDQTPGLWSNPRSS